MNYFVRTPSKEWGVEIRLDRLSPRVFVDGREITASLLSLPDGSRLLRIGETRHSVWVDPGEDGGSKFVVDVNGDSIEVEVLSDLQKRLRASAKAGRTHQGPQVVKAPMPCRVARVLVQAGQTVAAGQGLVVIEAMKMESEVKAAAAGTVKEVRAAAGAVAQAGDVLLRLE